MKLAHILKFVLLVMMSLAITNCGDGWDKVDDDSDDICDGHVTGVRDAILVPAWSDDSSIYIRIEDGVPCDGDGDGHNINSAAINRGNVGDDCNDNNPNMAPGLPEICDGLDNNCDGLIDNTATATIVYNSAIGEIIDTDNIAPADLDGDGWISPNATPFYDCDGDGIGELVDPSVILDAEDTNFFYIGPTYTDESKEEVGLNVSVQSELSQIIADNGSDTSEGWNPQKFDCGDILADRDPSVYPGAPEICDHVDNDCDGFIDMDDDAPDPDSIFEFYPDADGDGWGDANSDAYNSGCLYMIDDLEGDYSVDNDDCDDANPSIHPLSQWYIDADGDGFGIPGSNTISGLCTKPDGYALASPSHDCDDTNPAINPETIWYQDYDDDGYGNPAITKTGCSKPDNYVADNTDCDDYNPSLFPKSEWFKDADADGYPGNTDKKLSCTSPGNDYVLKFGREFDCDDNNSNLTPDTILWFADDDNDGYGATNGSARSGCTQPAGFVANETDCKDSDNTIHPGASEQCDGKDNDCDTQIDNGAIITFYKDTDADTFGDPNKTKQACQKPSGYVTNPNDCDDTKAQINPNKTWWLDNDKDGYGSSSQLKSCLKPDGYTDKKNDCDDTSPITFPYAPESCDSKDNNCNGSVDENTQNITYYTDSDGDGFGNPNQSTQSCTPPARSVLNNTDCNDNDKSINPNTIWYADTDRDSFGNAANTKKQCQKPQGYIKVSGDCNDTVATINPQASEICDGLDNNCDSQSDENAQITYYEDADHDSFGNAAKTQKACSPPENYVANSTDCNDANNAVNPIALETCDTLDNDCDSKIDDADTNVSGITTWYKDGDNDNYGKGTTKVACTKPNGFAAQNGDCNDTVSKINPAATEICDGKDNNCNNQTDENATSTYYQDADGDGFGNDAVTATGCNIPANYVAQGGDCNDNDAAIKPTTIWYADSDNDTFGDLLFTQIACSKPTGYVSNSSDCNDTKAAIKPNAQEVCDEVDNDCDSKIDDLDNSIINQTTWYRDNDQDGFGNISSTLKACQQPANFVDNSNDCDDNTNTKFPGNTDVCDGIDNNCDNRIDENGQTPYYPDADGDGYGSQSNSILLCQAQAGYVSNDDDCDDTKRNINPGESETCDNKDNNCNNQIDEDVLTTYYRDADSDNFGNPNNSTQACTRPSGFVTNNTDCDDGSNNIYPGKTEVCDTLDNNCNSQIDENLLNTYYEDGDNDSFGKPGTETQACTRPAGYASNNADCDDAVNTINPSASEICDGVDNDCDRDIDDADNSATNLTTWYRDNDNDTFGNTAQTQQGCAQPSGFVANNTDCNDNANAINPNATETCDTVDNNCNNQTDEGVLNTYYQDNDSDSYGGTQTTQACSKPSGYSTNNTDCNDNAGSINPGANESCDGEDNNCNNQTDEGVMNTYYQDSDNDNYGNASNTTQACNAPSGYVANNTDCNDSNNNIYPGKAEACDTLDNNCNNQTDEGVLNTYYRDSDSDNYGDAATTTQACTPPSGYVANNTDCRDNIAGVNPGAQETCNGRDDDCDNLMDDADNSTTGQPGWWRSADGDPWGAPNSTPVQKCTKPSGYVNNNQDCDDTRYSLTNSC